MVPVSKESYLKVQKAFEAWLVARGAELLTPTNEWEVLRFRHGDETAIVYSNKRGTLRWMGDSASIFKAYSANGAWRAMPATKRRGKSDPTCQALRKRDGDACFYCHLPVEPEDESGEHLVSITHGGPDHVANMALAHRECNKQAGHATLMEKIRIRETNWRRLNTPGTAAHLVAEALEDEAIDDLFDRSEWPPRAKAVPAAQVVADEIDRFDLTRLQARLEQVRDNPDHTTPPWSDK